ncbi:hypothetical protein AcW1_000813 [Taiwanofungus camphoratus]|nr:hypothetical protein AcV5_004714 [Antrodia cinnamomea]KAI0961839.1 hypothetical protein AcV7_000833 [Antrodia cinnamomea]KAI0963849.1 hypothetical protein AcW1_000813 [Antrodia cinnamomea]
MSAPSFSSFPPSFSSFPDFDPGPSTRTATPKDKERDKDKEKKRSKKEKGVRGRRERKRHEKHNDNVLEKDRTRSRRHSEDRAYEGYNDERLKAEEDSRSRKDGDYSAMDFLSAPLYITDRKGDPLNVQFGGLHAGHVPKYHQAGWGKSILGLESAWKVVHRGRKGIEVAVGGKRKLPALTDSSSRHILTTAPTRRLLASSEDKHKYLEIEGFLRLSTGRDRKDDQSYRSISTPKQNIDSDDLESSTEEAESTEDYDTDTTPMTSLQATLKSLEEQLSRDPSSIPTWLSLLSNTLSTAPITSKNAPKARSEITLSILSRALTANPDNSKSQSLRLRYLKAGEEIWHESKLRAEWENALKVGGVEMWMEWLDWRVRRGEKGVDGIVEDARRVLNALDAGEGEEIGKLRVLWRVAVAFRDAGFVERANALFQAQAELTYKLPPSLATASFEAQLDALEEFWESEVPRLGEAGASGWTSWVAAGRPAYILASTRKSAESDIADADPFRRWATAESLLDRLHQFPTRSFDLDTEVDADPYATILFSDLRPLLVPLHVPHARAAFRMVWLAFFGLHVPGFLASLSAVPGEGLDDRWAYTHFVSPAYLSSIFPESKSLRRITADAQAGVLVGREPEYKSAFGPVKSWGLGVLAPLECVGDGCWRMWGREDVLGLDEEVVREVFRQCRLGAEDVEWDMLALAFEATVSFKNSTKLSKAMLASAQRSLSHWAAHARLERLRGRVEDARKVYQTVLQSSYTNHSGESVLWWDWAEMEWLEGRSDAALQVTLRSAEAEGTGGIAILRTKRHLDEAIAQVPAARWKEREAWIKLRALLDLLTNSPHSALSIFDAYLSVLAEGTGANESLTIASLMLLYNHGIRLRNPVPPAMLRERAKKAIEAYPSNTLILGVFLEGQRGQGMWGGVRAMLGDNADGMMKEKDIVKRVAEVWVAGWEKSRWETEQERTRGGLSAAVQNERTRGSPVLWRLYVEFEIRAGQLERAKKLLFRAVGECPLVKELYILAFGPLRSVFSGRELNEWAETMAERGIRMRKGLDEMVEGWMEEREQRDEVNEEGMEDEIEHNARELRRLRPY